MGVHCIGASAKCTPRFCQHFQKFALIDFSDIGPKTVLSKQLILLLAPPYLLVSTSKVCPMKLGQNFVKYFVHFLGNGLSRKIAFVI